MQKTFDVHGILVAYWMSQPVRMQEDFMEHFIQRHQNSINHVLACFDRVLFRGTLRSISYVDGMEIFLNANHVLLKDFGGFVCRKSELIKQHAEQFARSQGRPFEYIKSPSISKEDFAKGIMLRDGISSGLICVLYCVEPCMSYAIHKDKVGKKLKLVAAGRKCLHFYFYMIDREFGFMHVRLQGWFPCPIQVCINGREWLAHKMDKAGIAYKRRDNCFLDIQQPQKAQQMADAMVTRNWRKLLAQFETRFNPLLRSSSGLGLHGYYWTIRQAEYATDVVFKDAAKLAAVYPRLTRHAIEQFSPDSIMRFLGQRHNSRFSGEVVSDLEKRIEGVRVKHRVGENSIKMYDKHGSVLRIETTINNPRRFRVCRETVRNGQTAMRWIPMRKGIADIYRLVEVSRAANARYLEALSVVGDEQPSHRVLDPVMRPVHQNGCRYRALRPIGIDDAKLFRSVQHGKFLVLGFRNADLRKLIYPDAVSVSDRRRAMGQTGRRIRLLQAHGLLRKVPNTRLYRVTQRGHRTMCTALIFRESDSSVLAPAA
jgi:hypothetical protein